MKEGDICVPEFPSEFMYGVDFDVSLSEPQPTIGSHFSLFDPPCVRAYADRVVNITIALSTKLAELI